MNTTHPIDCHILTTPSDDPAWTEQLADDLAEEPVNAHWLPGVPGEMGQARAAGYALGGAEYVSWACPDDRIVPGTFELLRQALEDAPFAPFAWAGEQRVDATLQELGAPAVHPNGHDQRALRNSPSYVHGVIVARRALVMPALPLLERARGTAGFLADWLLHLHLAAPHRQRPPGWEPVHVPVVGRLWRQHAGNAHRQIVPGDVAIVRRLAGVTPQYLHVIASARAARSATAGTDCPSCGAP